MRSSAKTIWVLALWVSMMPLDQTGAVVFIKPPETNAPVWQTPYPYQRNIGLDFGVSPLGTPGGGIPGASYEGSLDPTLKLSDSVSFTGSVAWYGALAGITPTGLIGIDNRLGTELLTGTALFHIANTSDLNLLKNLWIENLAITSYGGASAYLRVLDPLGGEATNLAWDAVEYNGEWLSTFAYQITPNPLYETVEWSFEAPAGGYIFLDETHIATECVPEPGASGLLALGALVMLWRRVRRAV